MLTLADTHATYSTIKRRNLIDVTRKTIINQDLLWWGSNPSARPGPSQDDSKIPLHSVSSCTQ